MNLYYEKLLVLLLSSPLLATWVALRISCGLRRDTTSSKQVKRCYNTYRLYTVHCFRNVVNESYQKYSKNNWGCSILMEEWKIWGLMLQLGVFHCVKYQQVGSVPVLECQLMHTTLMNHDIVNKKNIVQIFQMERIYFLMIIDILKTKAVSDSQWCPRR